MRCGRSTKIQSFNQEDGYCNKAFDSLLERIEDLSEDTRGAQALGFSAHLLELAAFELAGILGSDRAAELIECSAKLTELSDEATVRSQVLAPVAKYRYQ